MALGYNKRFGEFARLYQFAKLYMFDASSAVYTCPLAMTDGAARLMQLQLRNNASQLSKEDAELYKQAFEHLTSTDPDQFWTSGQWMTEKTGGSDVRNTETIAVPMDDGTYRLHGFKWFTSATDSQMTLALAKIKGSNSLSLFFVRIRDENGKLNGIKIHKLKDKLGTKALPTAELSLKDTKARLVGQPGKGVQTISCMLNITRLYNSICACSEMRRSIAIIQDYSKKRMVQGKPLSENILYRHTQAKMVAEAAGCLHLTMDVIKMMGRSEHGAASEMEEEQLRLLTPVAKLYTGKRSVSVVSEGIEMIGGQGYMEDTGIARMLRTSQVLPIWEGTTNVLSLDVLRVFSTRPKALGCWKSRINSILNSAKQRGVYCNDFDVIHQSVDTVVQFVSSLGQEKLRAELYARELAFSIAQTQIAAILLEYTSSTSCPFNQLLRQFLTDHQPLAPIQQCISANPTVDVNRELIVSRL